MSNKTDPIIGKRIEIYDILYVSDRKANDGHKLYHVKCSKCGRESDMRKADIVRAKHCTHITTSGNYIKFDTRWNNKRIGNIFHGMVQRCYKPIDKNYRRYGGRGIKICDEWLDNPMLFEKWSIENGYTDNLTIDRINVNGNYCPENCRWVTLVFNSKYKSTTRLINVDDEIYTGREWANILGLGPNIINTYVREYGMENTIEFIRRFKVFNKERNNGQSYYDLYMNDG